MGWPVSGTHTIIGALIGFACITIGPTSVDWSTIGGIVGSWFITPVIAGLFSLYHLCKYPETHFRYRRTAEKRTKIRSLLHGDYRIRTLYRYHGKRFKTRWFKSFQQ